MSTAPSLQVLHDALDKLRDELATSPDWCEGTAKGFLLDSDWDTLGQASSIVHRLMLWRKYPSVSTDVSYLPEPEQVPA